MPRFANLLHRKLSLSAFRFRSMQIAKFFNFKLWQRVLVVTVSIRISSYIQQSCVNRTGLATSCLCCIHFGVCMCVTWLDKDIKLYVDPKIYCCYLSTFNENNGNKWGVTRILYMKSSDCNKLMKNSIKISSKWTNSHFVSGILEEKNVSDDFWKESLKYLWFVWYIQMIYLLHMVSNDCS